MAKQELPVLNLFLELLPIVAFLDIGLAEVVGFPVDIGLDVIQQLADVGIEPVQRHGFFLQGVAPVYLNRTGSEVARSHGQPHRNALEFPFGELEAGTQGVAVVDLHALAQGLKALLYLLHFLQDGIALFFRFIDRNHHHMDRGESRGQDQAVVVSVGHDQRAHQTGRNAPGRSPDVFLLAFLVGELDVEGLGEVLAQEVGGTGLQGLAVLHHGLDGEGIQGTGKTLVRTLVSHDDRKSQVVAGKVGIDLDHAPGFFLGFLCGGMGRMAFLPEEFGRTEEEAGTHLPAHDVGPLVAQDGQVAPRSDPILIGTPDNGLGSRADNEFLLQFGLRIYDDALSVGVVHEAVMGNHRALLGETRHMFGLAAEERFRDEEREVCVLHACRLEHIVQDALHLFPDCISVRLDHHASAHGALFCQIGLDNQIVIPLRIILGTLRNLFCHNYICDFSNLCLSLQYI